MDRRELFPGGRFDTYLIRAAEARRIAASIKNPENKRVWDDIADSWENMAEQLVPDLRGGQH
jgi:hypothetical protein